MRLLQSRVQVLPWRLYNTDIKAQGLVWGAVKGPEPRTCITAWEQWMLFRKTPSGQDKLNPCQCPIQLPPFQHKCWVKCQDWFKDLRCLTCIGLTRICFLRKLGSQVHIVSRLWYWVVQTGCKSQSRVAQSPQEWPYCSKLCNEPGKVALLPSMTQYKSASSSHMAQPTISLVSI